ncbi:SDR family oxidoreductase [Paraglaciecola hydrolytica]|uniref:Short-chain dehydrogenase n=1 Tax=Paraglaciecola hydrolytica TaxID=1799789 RepID=A0A148KMF9_9ALTE|nr:SDR family oxidoreductase [Paraglaciecola hydrolytica]KXI27461.1 short-chain dehydrogenase [Paraglaciecola hydrolytica]
MTQCVLITGGASGLGAALVKQYAQRGATICIADLHAERAKKVIAENAQQATDVFFQPCDITSQADVEELLQVITERWGKLDILINNAGVATGGALAYEDIEQWEWVLNINLLGMVRMTRAFAPLLAKQSQSWLINIASQAGITPIPYMASYNASKAAVASFSETMHLELAKDGIHVSVVCPSFFATNLDESMRSKQPGVHELVKKLLSRSDINADDVANIIVKQAEAGDFMILSHKVGKKALFMKRFMPTNSYMRMMKKKLQRFGPKK